MEINSQSLKACPGRTRRQLKRLGLYFDSLDLFVLDDSRTNVQIHRFDPGKHARRDPSLQMLTQTLTVVGQVYRLVHEVSSPKLVENVIPADFNQDGRLDLLLLSADDSSDQGWWAHRGDGLIATLHLQEKDGLPGQLFGRRIIQM